MMKGIIESANLMDNLIKFLNDTRITDYEYSWYRSDVYPEFVVRMYDKNTKKIDRVAIQDPKEPEKFIKAVKKWEDVQNSKLYKALE